MSSLLEIARALLTAHARNSPAAAPVHVVRLAAGMRRRGIDVEVTQVLNSLQVLREAQDIKNGFWIPAPTCVVRHELLSLAISGSTTAELRRRIRIGTPLFGAARLALEDTHPSVPWLQWSGSPQDSMAWAEREISRCLAMSIRAIEGDSLEIYRHWQSSAPRWSSSDGYTGVAICRLRGTLGTQQYFLCELRAGRVCTVADIPQDRDFRFRLQIALSRRDGRPQTFSATRSPTGTHVSCRPLPTEELRVFTALTRIDTSEAVWRATMQPDHYEVVRSTLVSLGLKEQAR